MKHPLRIIGALLAALLLGFLFLLFAAGLGQDVALFFFIISLAIGLVGYSVLLLRAQTPRKALGLFNLFFGVEWLLLPAATAVCAQTAIGFGAIGAGLLLALSMPIGLVLGCIFLVLAYFNLRYKPESAS